MAEKKEMQNVANVLIAAGHKNVTPEMVHKVPNKWDSDVYVAVIGDAMLVYTPQWTQEPIKFVCF